MHDENAERAQLHATDTLVRAEEWNAKGMTWYADVEDTYFRLGIDLASRCPIDSFHAFEDGVCQKMIHLLKNSLTGACAL